MNLIEHCSTETSVHQTEDQTLTLNFVDQNVCQRFPDLNIVTVTKGLAAILSGSLTVICPCHGHQHH